MLAHLAARLAPLSRRGVLSLADEPKDDDDKKSSLRRFETILSADGAADIGNEDVAAEADAASAAISEAEEARAAAAAASQAALDAAAAELSEKVGRLRDILDAQQAVNDEGARLQRAVQRQEEEDSLKMIALLRAQAEAHASELGETKAAVEEAVIGRMRLEAEEEMARADERAAEMQAAHEQQLEEARRAAQAEAEAAVAEAEARMAVLHEKALLADRERAGEQVDALGREVSALSAVLSQDTAYKRTSHATHQLASALLTTHEAVASGANTSPAATAASLRALAAISARLDDELGAAATAPFSTREGAEHYARTPSLPQLATRFVDVAASCRTAALVPEGSGLWGHALAFVTSKLTLRAAETGHTETSEIVSRAEAALERGSLLVAVSELRELRGHPADACSGWLRAAEERLRLQQALTVAKAEATIATAALTS